MYPNICGRTWRKKIKLRPHLPSISNTVQDYRDGGLNGRAINAYIPRGLTFQVQCLEGRGAKGTLFLKYCSVCVLFKHQSYHSPTRVPWRPPPPPPQSIFVLNKNALGGIHFLILDHIPEMLLPSRQVQCLEGRGPLFLKVLFFLCAI